MPQLRLPASLAPLVFTPSRRGYDFFLTWPYLVLQYFRSIFPNGQEHARLQPGQMCESTTIPDPAALAQLSSRSCSSLPLVVPNQLFRGGRKGTSPTLEWGGPVLFPMAHCASPILLSAKTLPENTGLFLFTVECIGQSLPLAQVPPCDSSLRLRSGGNSQASVVTKKITLLGVVWSESPSGTDHHWFPLPDVMWAPPFPLCCSGLE